MIRSLLAIPLALGLAASAQQAPRAPGLAWRDTPLLTDIYIADPSAHVFGGRIHVYGSHDIDAPAADDQPGKGYAMRDYRIVSFGPNGGDPIVHPPALKLEDVPWASRQLWAPDAAFRDGRYFLFFPAKDRDGVFRIGVATGTAPEGPFKAEPQPIAGSYSIDPAVFIDDDGQAYMYFGGIHGGQLQRWASGKYDPAAGDTDLNRPDAPALMPKVARLTRDLKRFAEPPRDAMILDAGGKPLLGGDLPRRFFEAAWMHKRKGVYYLSYSTGDTHFIAYATSRSPRGPFTWRGIILLPVQGWTTHHSIVETAGGWRLFYHDTQLSNRNNLRGIKTTELIHNTDGTIRTIDPFMR